MAGTHYIRYVEVMKVPVDALRLTEDIRALEQCRKILETVDVVNVCEDLDTGRMSIRLLNRLLRSCQTYAERKMRSEYLAPQRKKIERTKTPTV